MLEQKPQRLTEALELKQESSALNEFARNTATATEEMPASAAVGPARENLNAPEPTSGRRISERRRTDQKDDVGVATSFSTSVQPATVAVELAPPAEDSPESTRESDLDAGGATSAGSMGGQVSSAFVVTARSRTDTPAWPAADVWLAGIRFLLEQGELERVEAELDKFREHYPDYPLGELVQGTDED
jgi:hypothetical protein